MLRARELVFDYPGGRRALSGVELELAPGELLALIGPNGSGKSTLLRLCSGFLAPTRGSVELDGAPLHRMEPRERARRIAVVPQGLRALPDARVRDFVLGGRYPHLGRLAGFLARATSADHAAVERALSESDAADLVDRRLDEISAGQLQRVLLARALSQEATLFLCDEPTAALDPEHQVRVFQLLEGLVRSGRAALVATHELNLASRFAQRCLLLEAGRVVASGSPEDVFRPDVLAPVFGRHLHFSRSSSAPHRPLVVPWPAEERSGGSPSSSLS